MKYKMANISKHLISLIKQRICSHYRKTPERYFSEAVNRFEDIMTSRQPGESFHIDGINNYYKVFKKSRYLVNDLSNVQKKIPRLYPTP